MAAASVSMPAPTSPAGSSGTRRGRWRSKCDLCAGARYRLEEGGPHGKQACVEVCPMRAIALIHKAPNQRGDDGYNVNLRNEHWAWLGIRMTECRAE